MTLGELFTDRELNAAKALWDARKLAGFRFADECARRIVEPALTRINAKTGQQNDARYWAYAIEYAIMKAEGH